MRLQVVHFAGRNPRPGQRLLDHPLLRRTVRHREPRARPALIHRRAADHGQDPVAVALRVGEPLQNHHPATLAPHEAVRIRSEGAAVAARGQQPQLRHELRHSGGQDRVHATREGHVHLAPLQAHGGLVHCSQGRCAGHVQRHRRSRQSQRKGHPSDRDASGGSEIPDLLAAERDHVPILASTQPRVHPGATAPQRAGIDSRVLERLPGRLQQQPLARVHRPCLDGPDAEESCVEAVDPLDEAAVTIRVAPGPGVGRQAIPADGVRTPVRHRAAPLLEQPPEGVEIRRAGETARHADDCDAVLDRPRRRTGHRFGQGLFGQSLGSGGLRFDLTQLLDQVPGQRSDVRVVEHHRIGRGVVPREGPIQPVPQLDRHERVHAEIEEPDRGVRRRRQAEHGLHLPLQERNHEACALRHRRFPQPGRHVGRRSRAAVVGLRVRREEIFQEGGTCLDRLFEDGPVHRHHHGRRHILAHQPLHRLQALLRGEPAASQRRTLPLDPVLLLGRLADLGPCSPCDGLSRESHRATVAGELIEEGVGRGVIRLSGIAHHPDAAREENEEVEVSMLGRAMQVPGGQDLRPEDMLEPRPALVGQRAVRQHSHAVNHARQGRQVPVDAIEHPVDAQGVGNVRQLHDNVHPALAKRADRFLGVRIRLPASIEHDRPRAMVGQPHRHRASDSAQAAGHQVGPIRSQAALRQWRRGHDDLSEMPGGSHESQCGPRFAERPSAVHDRLQLSRLQPPHDVAQDPSDPRRLGLLQDIELQDVVTDVGTERGHLLLAQDVPSSQLHESPALLEAGETRVDESLARQAVEDDIHPLSARGLEDPAGELRAAAVEQPVDAERPEIGLLGRTRGGEDFGAGGLHELDRGQTHPARPGVDEHALAGLEPRELERERRRHEGARHTGQLAHRVTLRRGRHELFPRDHLRPERAESHSDHPVSNRDAAHIGPCRENAAAHLPAEQPFPDETEGPEHVPEVESGRIHADEHLLRLEGTHRERLRPRAIEGAALIRSQHPVRLLRQDQPSPSVAGPDEPRNLTAPPSVRDVVLGVGIQQFVDEIGRRRHRRRVQIDHPRTQVRRLPVHGLAETPQHRAGERPTALALEDLRPAGQEPHSLLRRPVRIGHPLDQGQRARPGARHVLHDFPGGRLRAVAVQPHAVDHAVEGKVPGQSFHEPSPRVPPVCVYRRVAHARTGGERLGVSGPSSAGQDDRLVARRQPLREIRGEAVLVRGQDPGARKLPHLRRSLRHDHALVHRLGRIGLVHSENFDLLETGVGERPPPHRGTGESVMRTEVVGEAPPAVELPEGEIHPAQTAKVLERDQVPGRCEQSPAVRQRLLQVACRVQYVGRYGQVIAVEVEALFDRVLLDIERAVLDASPAIAEACLRFREETRRDVGVHVVEAPFGELRQHRRGRGSRTRSDLDHPEPPSRRERGHEGADRLAQHLVRRARHRRPQVEIGRGRLPAAEEQRQGIGLPPKHVGERAARAPEQPDLGQPVRIALLHPLGMRLRILGKRRGPRVPGSRPHHEGVVLLRQHPGSGRHLEHPAEEALVFRVDVQRLAQLLGPDSLPDLSDPSQPIQVCDREGLRPPLQVRQQGVPTPGIDPGITQVVREEAGAGLDRGRAGEEIRGLHSGRQGAFLPRHFVEQLVDAFDRRE